MHLLVLSAFRLEQTGKKAAGAHRVSMHLLVLSAFRLVVDRPRLFVLRSQCTFWCSVLSDINLTPHELNVVSLNAPSGAQCFPTGWGFPYEFSTSPSQCTFWCSVLSDIQRASQPIRKEVSMHLLVLSAFRRGSETEPNDAGRSVSMHLLVLSAFRRWTATPASLTVKRLNAPSGAQCFPTEVKAATQLWS